MGERNVRNAVRQELISRQLERHLAPCPVRILDVGAGQGAQSIRLARTGRHVLAVEPDAELRTMFAAGLTCEPADVRARITLVDGSIGNLTAAVGDAVFDAVLLLGVLMYLPASQPVIDELAAHVAPGGLLAIATRTTTSAIWRPAGRQYWLAALAAFGERDTARAEGRDMTYVNEIGANARADDFATLIAHAAENGLQLEQWYGVRTAVDMAEIDPDPPAEPAKLAALLDVEDRLSAIDPYRQLAQLAHLLFRRPNIGPNSADVTQ